MKRLIDIKLRLFLLSVMCILPCGWLTGKLAGEGSSQNQKIYTANSQGETQTLPLAYGTSYYQYQWGLKNIGGIQRITSVYQSNYREWGENTGFVQPNYPEGSIDNTWEIQKQVIDSVAGIDIGMEPAWAVYEQSTERRPVTVAIIHTGVDISHPELQNSIWINADEIPGDGIDNDNNGYIDDIYGWNFYSGNNQVFNGAEDDHGTHGAGTIAGAWDSQGISGIADSAYVKIMVLKVLGTQEGRGISNNVKQAIRYAQDNGADICNLSMGTLTYDAELDAIIRNSPMLFIVSAGNGDAVGRGYSIDDLPMYPASYSADNIISVGNLMFNGALDESSNYGAFSVDIAAPGTYILGAIPGGYAFMSGTSMAAPMVAGVAALVYSCRMDLDLIGVRRAIIDTAKPMESMNGKTVTGGSLNAYGAIMYGR